MNCRTDPCVHQQKSAKGEQNANSKKGEQGILEQEGLKEVAGGQGQRRENRKGKHIKET